MLIFLLYWLLVLLCCGYAVAFGGVDGRRITLAMVVGSLLTIPAADYGRGWAEIELYILLIDAAMLVVFYVLMLSSRRYWPIWVTGFHIPSVVSHLSTLLAPGFTPQIYRALETFWAIPMLLALLIGVELDRRAGLPPSGRRSGVVPPGTRPGR